MFSAISDFFSSVLSFFTSIGEFIVKIGEYAFKAIADLLYVGEVAAKVVVDFPSYINWLPSSVVVLLSSIIAVIVILRISGRF